jgi:predicted RNA binding protein YcfA (HicA-like mRNA interferase family)
VRSARLLARLRSGHLQNVPFSQFCRLVELTGFTLVRVKGSHHIYRHQTEPLIISLQNAAGCAKPYQIRQFLRTMDQYTLNLREGT